MDPDLTNLSPFKLRYRLCGIIQQIKETEELLVQLEIDKELAPDDDQFAIDEKISVMQDNIEILKAYESAIKEVIRQKKNQKKKPESFECDVEIKN